MCSRYPLPVEVAEMGGSIHVQLLPEGEQGPASLPVFLAQIKLAQPPFQAMVADIVGLAFADYSAKRLIRHTVLHQHVGQKRQVFVLNSILESDRMRASTRPSFRYFCSR